MFISQTPVPGARVLGVLKRLPSQAREKNEEDEGWRGDAYLMSGLWGEKGGEGPEGIAKEAHHERKGGRSTRSMRCV